LGYPTASLDGRCLDAHLRFSLYPDRAAAALIRDLANTNGFTVNELSTAKKQFLAEIDRIRRLRRRYWLSLIALPFAGIAGGLGAVFVHPLLILAIAVPAAMIRIYGMQLIVAKCPRCGESFIWNPHSPPTLRSTTFGLLEPGSRCAHCDFPV
jgi:hypothetical protein